MEVYHKKIIASTYVIASQCLIINDITKISEYQIKKINSKNNPEILNFKNINKFIF